MGHMMMIIDFHMFHNGWNYHRVIYGEFLQSWRPKIHAKVICIFLHDNNLLGVFHFESAPISKVGIWVIQSDWVQ